MTREELDVLFSKPEHWKWECLYYCPEDPRIVVPKRVRWMGWTINFARPLALPFLAALIASMLVAVWVMERFIHGDLARWLVLVLIIAGLVALCAWMANPRRFTDK